MTRGELEQLSGAEIIARLVHRGVPVERARLLVQHRNDNYPTILRIINMERRTRT